MPTDDRNEQTREMQYANIAKELTMQALTKVTLSGTYEQIGDSVGTVYRKILGHVMKPWNA
jgi:hypothetical protein